MSIVNSLFAEQRELVAKFFRELDVEAVEDFCHDVLTCEGTVVCTGVGKSGFIAQKICMTLVSTGTKSIFLNPSDALHGDIGIIGPFDILVLFSKSGSTEELISLIPYARARRVKRVVAITSNEKSKLSNVCDEHIYLPLPRELCPFNLAPVTSTAIQMIFGDTCAVALMIAKCISKDEYAMNHPAGRIGKSLVLRVSDLIHGVDKTSCCGTSEILENVLFDMSAKGFGCILITEEQTSTLVGVFSDGDLRRKLNLHGKATLKMKMGDLMTQLPRVIPGEAKAIEALKAMKRHPSVSFLPVVDASSQKLSGLICLTDLVAAGL